MTLSYDDLMKVIRIEVPREVRREFLRQKRDYARKVDLNSLELNADLAIQMEIKKYLNKFIHETDFADEIWKYLFAKTRENDILNDLCEGFVLQYRKGKEDSIKNKEREEFLRQFASYWIRTEEERNQRKEKAIWLLQSE